MLRLVISKIDGGEMWSKMLRRIALDYHGISIGIGTYGGIWALERVPKGTTVGAYCSFAQNVYIYNANHPLHWVSTHPLFYNPVLGVVTEDKVERSLLTVGNDVWIGQNVIITASCKDIGDGAIVGAGSVVTRDVYPYTIVAGVPAKIIGKRFRSEVADAIRSTHWWTWRLTEIIEKLDLFYHANEFVRSVGIPDANDTKSDG